MENENLVHMWQFYLSAAPPHHLPTTYYGEKDARELISTLLEKLSELIPQNDGKKVLDLGNFDSFQSLFYFVGDIHGAYNDLHSIITFFIDRIEQSRKLGITLRIIFLGDYVDRHSLDLHTLLFLLLFKLQYPDNVVLIRGNHEEQIMNKHYGFRRTVLSRFSLKTYQKIQQFFSRLPLTVLFSIDKQYTVIALHGGVPINDEDPDIPIAIRSVELFSDTTNIKEMDFISQQILWNDPSPSLPSEYDFYPNRFRSGTFYEFNENIFTSFMKYNHLNLMIRGHQFFDEGYRFFFKHRLLSLFSTQKYNGLAIDGRIAQLNFNSHGKFDVNIRILRLADLMAKIYPEFPEYIEDVKRRESTDSLTKN